MDNLTKYAAMIVLILGWFSSGCGKNALKPATPMPAGCQRFLDTYFEAVKSKDVGKIRGFSSYVSYAQSEAVPASSIDMMRETRGRFAVETFERMNKEFGDFQSYFVISVKEATVTRTELAANKMEGTRLQGVHAEIVCKAKFSEKNLR